MGGWKTHWNITVVFSLPGAPQAQLFGLRKFLLSPFFSTPKNIRVSQKKVAMFCFTWAFPWYNPPFPKGAFFASQTAKAQRIEASLPEHWVFADVRFLKKKKRGKQKNNGNAWKWCHHVMMSCDFLTMFLRIYIKISESHGVILLRETMFLLRSGQMEYSNISPTWVSPK